MSPAGSPDESTSGRADAVSDRDLLTRFVRRHDERAFAEIVGRYGGLVLGVCRRVLSDTHSAEDAFQATFLVLARSARKIRKRRSLAAWLHGVALRVSKRALAVQKRRREKQCKAPEMTVDTLADITALYEQQMLDEQLQHLPEKYREPLVLHYLQGQSQQQVAEQLGLSVAALEGRLRRGRHELRRRLVRTGVGLGAALAAAHVASSTASAGSASLQPLIAATAKAAAAHAASQAITSLVSQEAASLAGKELAMIAASKAMATVGLSSAAVALVLVGIGAAGVGDSPSAGGVSGAAPVVAGGLFGPAEEPGQASVRLARVVGAGAPADEQQTAEQVEIKLLRDQVDQLRQALDGGTQFSAADLKPRDARTTLIEATLDKAATLEFPANPIKDVVDFLSEAHQIPILLDEATLADEGVTPDVEISLVISGISLRNAMEILLENVGGVKLDYVIEHQVLKITTREKADQTLDTRVYNLRALENSGFESYSVANVIRKTIEPASWAHIEIVPEQGAAGMDGMMGEMMMGMGAMPGMGGRSGMMGDSGLGAMQIDRKKSTGLGTIEALPGCLVITQCQRVHRGVADLLEQLKAQAAETDHGPFGPEGFPGGGSPPGSRSPSRIGRPLLPGGPAPLGPSEGTTAPPDSATGQNSSLGDGQPFYNPPIETRPSSGGDAGGPGAASTAPGARGANDPGAAQHVRGTIRVEGELAPRRPLVPVVGNSLETRHLTDPIPDESVVVGPDGGLANCIVFPENLPAGLPPTPVPDEPAVLLVQRLQFTPHAMIVRRGQRIQMTNQDPVVINVHDMPYTNAPIGSVLAPKGSLERYYDEAEKLPVRIKSDIHPWMSAWVLPLDHPWAAVTDEHGRFELPELPPGEYTFKVWHEKAGYINRQLQVTVTAEGAQELQLTVDAAALSNN